MRFIAYFSYFMPRYALIIDVLSIFAFDLMQFDLNFHFGF